MKSKLLTMFFCIAIGGSSCAFALDDGSQGGGFSSLLKGLNSVLNGGATASGASGNNAANDEARERVLAAIKVQASVAGSYYKNCSASHFQEQRASLVDGAVQRAEYSTAAAAANVVAGEMARCAQNDIGNLPDWSSQIGQLLALSAISSKNAGMGDIDSVRATASRAKVLLSYAKNNNAPNAQEYLDGLKTSGFDVSDAKGEVKSSSGKVALSGSTAMVAKKYQENKVAFKKEYLGKLIQVKGPVRLIQDHGGRTPGATVILRGVDKDIDLITSADEVNCEISDEKNMDAAAKLKVGKLITVKGIYDPKQPGLSWDADGVVLRVCQIQ